MQPLEWWVELPFEGKELSYQVSEVPVEEEEGTSTVRTNSHILHIPFLDSLAPSYFELRDFFVDCLLLEKATSIRLKSCLSFQTLQTLIFPMEKMLGKFHSVVSYNCELLFVFYVNKSAMNLRTEIHIKQGYVWVDQWICCNQRLKGS